jgi:mRNA interferase MazF
MKYSIVLVPFPFDDLSSLKVRPAVCLTSDIQPFGHVVRAFITSHVSSSPAETDLVVEIADSGFERAGLKVSSTIRLHRLLTVSGSIVRRRLGKLSKDQQRAVEDRLRKLFEI